MIMFRLPRERKDMATQNAVRGELVNTSAVESPEATGEYWISYRDTRRRNTAEMVKVTAKIIVTEITNFHHFNMFTGY